ILGGKVMLQGPFDQIRSLHAVLPNIGLQPRLGLGGNESRNLNRFVGSRHDLQDCRIIYTKVNRLDSVSSDEPWEMTCNACGDRFDTPASDPRESRDRDWSARVPRSATS